MKIAAFTDAQCPWVQFKLGPMITCEERLCSWVRQPSNSWSSLIFLALIFYFFRESRRSRNRILADFWWISILLGVFSFFAHASQTFIFSTFDYLTQYAVISYVIVLNLLRIGIYSNRKWNRFSFLFSILFGLACLAQLSFSKPGTVLFAGLASAALLSEGWILLKSKQPPKMVSSFWVGSALLITGAICFALDAEKYVCYPENHSLQLHSFWHIFTAGALLYLVDYYKQFEKLRR
jgi:drug/metabolite transporter (DMT)-like permease